MLSRTYGWILLCLVQIISEFDIETNGHVERLFEKFTNMQESDEQSGVLRIKAVGS